MTQSPYGAKV